MGRSSYPTGADLQALFASGSITPNPTQATNAVLAGIDEFERECNRHFLAGKDTSNQTVAPLVQTFDPASELDGLVYIPDLARIDAVALAPPNSAPQALTSPTDYHPQPPNAPALGRPYTALRFLSRYWKPLPYGLGNILQITGLWGYSTSIPDLAWQGMLYAGAGQLMPMVGAGRFRGVKSFSEAGTSVTFGYDVGGWAETYEKAVWSYRRAEV